VYVSLYILGTIKLLNIDIVIHLNLIYIITSSLTHVLFNVYFLYLQYFGKRFNSRSVQLLGTLLGMMQTVSDINGRVVYLSLNKNMFTSTSLMYTYTICYSPIL